MRKIVKGILITILAIVGMLVVFVAWTVVQSMQVREALFSFDAAVENVCHLDEACEKKIGLTYAQCDLPFFSIQAKADCIHKAIADINNRFTPGLDEPSLSRDQIIAWARHAAQDTLDFDYKNADEKLNHAESYFTPGGWKSFLNALKDSNIVEAVKGRKMAIELIPEGEIEIKNSVVSDDVYRWYLEFPITLQFKAENGMPPSPIKSILVLQIERSPKSVNPDGVGIEQWVTVNSTKDQK